MDSISQRDGRFLWHPYTQHRLAAPFTPITRAKGSYLFDESGTPLLDAISSWWTTLHGHGHPYIAQKIHEQALNLEHVIFAGFTHEPAVNLAGRLLPLLPGDMSRLFFSDNGSTAVEVALKMAIQFHQNQGRPNRKKILALQHAYHGDTFGAMSVSERGLFTQPFNGHLFPVEFVDIPTEEDESWKLPSLSWEEIACIIYEPVVQGAGGMRMYHLPSLEKLLTQCRDQGILLIADEVMTGFGRTGTLFASEQIQVLPDIVCMSKGLTGGTLPMALTACREFIYEAFLQEDRLKTFFHGHSFTANPIGCASALASLDLLQDAACQEQIRLIVTRHRQKVEQWKSEGRFLQPRSAGTILAFEVEDKENNYLNTRKEAIMQMALKKGVLLRPLGNTVYCMPPYSTNQEELDLIYRVMEMI
ncbi:MAG: adenosylmethionine--8-amino-7-oxononanoate transaminase [Chitinophagales bacterium]|nr:adenosylmethionine--8-amino-7-oxononanoate transaminase [Chitinophagales bacterium]